jgi:sulfatase modifying factor 1
MKLTNKAISQLLSIVLSSSSAAQAVTLDLVNIGNVDNAADVTGFGAVGKSYRIGKYEVTNSQYAEFLNAVAAVDSSSLYLSQMTTDPRGGILREGVAGNYAYQAKPNFAEKPVTFALFTSALRFANWMHNGQPVGLRDETTTEDGAYTLTSLTSAEQKRPRRNPGAKWFLPNEDEWYKAAYHQPLNQGGDADHYWLYATRSNDLPTEASSNATGQVLNPVPNVANYGEGADWNGVNGNVTDIGGAGLANASFYGTFDQTGNVSEWIEGGNENAIDELNVFRGGNWDQFNFQFDPMSGAVTYVPELDISSVVRNFAGHNSPQVGFRLASLVVPEPPSWLLGAVSLICAAAHWRPLRVDPNY